MLQNLGFHLGLLSVNVHCECSTASVIKLITLFSSIWIPGIFCKYQVLLFHIIVTLEDTAHIFKLFICGDVLFF